MKKIFYVLILLGLGACAPFEEDVKDPAVDSLNEKHYVTPTKQVFNKNIPKFLDDIDFDWMELAIERQLKRFAERRANGQMNGTIQLGEKKYKLDRVEDSLRFLLKLIKERGCCTALTDHIVENFDIFEPALTPEDPRYGEPKPAFFTAYYTPVIKGSSVPTEKIPYPIYRKPPHKDLASKTRGEIDFGGAFDGKGLELFYGPDFFELYLLHVEGGGKVEFKNSNGEKDSIYLSYDGTNRKSWNFISRHMKKQGYIKSGSIAAQRRYLERNPDKWEEIYSTCPSYVYFKTTDHPPFGSDRVPLTDRRSIALDSKLFKFKGLLTFVKSRRPLEKYKGKKSSYRKFTRFFIHQDTGGAIKGKARADLFMGESLYAKNASALMKERGDIYFLMLKDGVP